MLETLKLKLSLVHTMISNTKDEERRDFMKKAVEICAEDIKTVDVLLTDKTKQDFQISYGCLTGKMGLLCYNLDLMDYNIYFAQVSCQQLTRYCTACPTLQVARIDETNLWVVYDNLVEYYKRSKKWKCAMETVVKGVLIDSRHLASFAKRWVQIKLSALDDGLDEYINMNLRSTTESCEFISDELLISFLKAELQVFQKKKSVVGINSTLKQLVDVLTDKCEKTTYCILLASNNQIDSDETTTEDYLNVALSLMPTEKKATKLEKILIGQIYLWQYIHKHEEACSKVAVEETQKGDKLSKNNEDEEASIETKQLFTLADEEDMVVILDKAVSLWQECYTISFDDPMKKQYFIESLQLCSSIYNSLKRPVKEAQVLAMLNRLCEEGNESLKHKINMDVVRLLTSLGLCKSAVEQLANIQHCYTDTSTLPVNDQLLYHIRKIQATLSLVVKGKNEELLQDLDDNLSQRQQSDTTTCLLKGIINRLLSTVTSLQKGDHFHTIHYALDHGHDAVRLHTSVTQFFLGKKYKGGSYQQKWLIVNELLESLLNLAQMYRFIGDDSLARCYTREGIRVAQGLLLPRWYLLFMFEMTRIHSITCCLKDSQEVLKNIASILHPDDSMKPTVTFPFYDDKVKTCELKISQRKRSLVEDCFGFESIRDAGVHHFSGSHIDLDLAEMPVELDLPKVFIPDHSSNCLCVVCKDESLLNFNARYWFHLGEVCYHNQYYSQAVSLLNKVIEWHKQSMPKLSKKLIQIEQTLVPSVTMNDKLALPDFSLILCECYCLLAECSIHLYSDDASKNMCNEALKTLESFNLEHPEQNLLRARVNMCLVQLELSHISTLSYDLTSNLGNLCITEKKSVDPSQDLCVQFEKCHLEENKHTDKAVSKQKSKDSNKHKQKKSMRKIKFDSPDLQIKSSDSPDLPTMDDTIDSEKVADVSFEVIPNSPETTSHVLFSKTPLVSCKKSRKNTCSLNVTSSSPSSDEVFVMEDEQINRTIDQKENEPTTKKSSRKNKPCSEIKSRSLKTSVNNLHAQDESSVTRTNGRTKRQARGRVDKTYCELDDSNIETESNGKEELEIKSRIPRLKIYSPGEQPPEKEKRSRKKVSTTVDNHVKATPKTKGISMKKSTLNIDSEEDEAEDEIPETKSSRSIRKSKATTSKLTEPRSRVKRSSKKQTEDLEIMQDIYEFDEAGSPIKTKGASRKKSGRSTKKKVEVCKVEKLRNSENETEDLEIMQDIYEFDEAGSPVKTKCASRKKSGRSTKKKVEVCKVEKLRHTEKTPEITFSHVTDIRIVMTSPPLSDQNNFLHLSSAVVEPELFEEEIEILRGRNIKSGKTKNCKSKVNVVKESVEVLRSDENTYDVNDKESVTSFSQNISSKTNVDHSHLTVTLLKAYEQVRHFPASPSYPMICKLLALQYIHTSPDKTAFYLTESAAVTFRHQILVDVGRKIRKLKKEKTVVTSDGGTDIKMYNDVRQSLVFDKDNVDITTMLNNLPSEWTVCQLSVVENMGKTSQMLLTRFTKEVKPITVQLPAFINKQGINLLDEFACIMDASAESMKLVDKYEFWKNRKLIDERLEEFQDNMQKEWLGLWRNLLRAQIKDNDEVYKLCRETMDSLDGYHLSNSDKDIIKVIITISEGLSCVEILEMLSRLLNTDDKTAIKNIGAKIQLASEKLSFTTLHRYPVILILDKVIQHLPWENIGVLRSHCVTRIPSLYYLSTQLTSLRNDTSNIYNCGVNPDNTYYIINPDNNLPSTQEFFQTAFKEKTGWKGIVGERPTADQFSKALTQYDLFIYCGHGDGGKYLSGEELQKLRCRSAVILMGCSSGLLKSKGYLDVFGTVMYYFLAGCPCVVANLWNVTDREIDRFSKSLIDIWLESENGTSLADVLPKAREACRLLNLTGSAPVVYGLPVSINKSVA
ncbi:uncharacterized protein LOC126821652 [Patella vulgata]|uniref:uncharacterized protein LOC126821652 n=1 Tax=Patella vulgata TaxID=6465 RepID=UPI0024A82E4E|nr:uncharacterized protein LOC126821652 [Patella vulgata]